jgi:hypothetical protein
MAEVDGRTKPSDGGAFLSFASDIELIMQSYPTR